MMSVRVISWWYFLCAVGVLNTAAWSLSAVALRRRAHTLSAEVYRARRLQLLFSAVYVAGCAYRCFFLVYDVPRICLFDTVFSSVIIGRSVATLAELSFVAQWALMLRETSTAAGSTVGRVVSAALVPLIAIAETCSWYSVLTTSNLGHVAEESIWGLSAALLVVSVAAIMPHCSVRRRPMLLAWCSVGLIYVAFMFLVDVPMYWARWLADEAARRPYMSISQGVLDTALRRVVSYRWEDWKNEVVWMSLYFSGAVWISISLIHAPAFKSQKSAGARRRLPASATSGTRQRAAHELAVFGTVLPPDQ